MNIKHYIEKLQGWPTQLEDKTEATRKLDFALYLNVWEAKPGYRTIFKSHLILKEVITSFITKWDRNKSTYKNFHP